MSIERFADYSMAFILIICIVFITPFYLIGLVIEAFAPQTPESEHDDYYHRY